MIEINKFRKADELKGKIQAFLKPDQINELAAKKSIPHYELVHPLTGNISYWFIQEEITEWIKDYFVKYQFTYQTEVTFVNFDENFYNISPTDAVPVQLSLVKGLFKLPLRYLHTPPGIYFLCKEGKLIYIGKAVNIGTRIMDHRNNKDFDSVYFINCHIDQLTKIEIACIKFFKPPLNIIFANAILNEGDKNVLEKILIRDNNDQIS